MKKILFTLFILMIFNFCKTENRKKVKVFDLPENTTFYSVDPQSFIAHLSVKLEENSGIILYENLLWTFNDSGGGNKIYAFDFSGEIIKEITVENAKNVDWEDIAQDKKYIYIGDFGNNYGIRSNQKIYRIRKKDITKEINQVVKAEEIGISFADQESFSFQHLKTKYDCEALVEFKNKLYLFTKNWEESTTSVYSIPKKKGDYNVKVTEKFDVNGLVTGADISPDETRLALIGYKDYKPFAWIFSGITNESFFRGEKKYLELDGIFGAQTEGVCFKGNDTLLISCEKTSSFYQQVFFIDLDSIK